jgi:hypothetical protein
MPRSSVPLPNNRFLTCLSSSGRWGLDNPSHHAEPQLVASEMSLANTLLASAAACKKVRGGRGQGLWARVHALQSFGEP